MESATLAQQTPEELEARHVARNYKPLPVTVAHAEGVWVHDTAGRRYLDALSAYSALNFGHRHPELIAAAHAQLDRVTLTSRAFRNDQLGPFCRDLAAMCGKELVLTMNTGAEAVETAIKVTRKWGYERKGVAGDRAEIITFAGNFHGRTTTIVSFSDDPLARTGFGPFTPGFQTVPYGDLDAVAAAIGPNTVGVLLEPIQGEAGVVIPPVGFVGGLRALCSEHDVLLMGDEIQSGLGRTGRTFALEHEGVVPDLYILGKALGGGVLPLSAVVAGEEVLGVLKPGEHGSTFGGNPLACAVGRAALRLLAPGDLQERAASLGGQVLAGLQAIESPHVASVRGRGLWFGIDLHPDGPPARDVCEKLLGLGVLAKDTHEHTIRLAPPLVIEESDLDWMVAQLAAALA